MYSNRDHFTGLTGCIEVCGGHIVVQNVQVTLDIECLPTCLYDAYVSPLAEYIPRANILTDACLDTRQGEFQCKFRG